MWSEQISPKAKNTGIDAAAGGESTLAYIAPFVVFVLMLGARQILPIRYEMFALLRFAVVAAAVAIFSRRVIPWRVRTPGWSILLGIAVCAVWVGPDLLWKGYRHFWLFENSLTGKAVSSLPEVLRAPGSLGANAAFLTLRVVESAILIPILEELFWRGWLMRWLIRQDFLTIPLGQYVPSSFWLVAVLFAAEHGPYWEVGLIAGVAYNWWVVRTKSLADCILAHGVTNAALAAYVLWLGQWQYWL